MDNSAPRFDASALERDPGGWTMRLPAGTAVRAASFADGARAVTARGGGQLTVWCSQPDATTDEAAASAGFVTGRDLLQLRRSLPLDLPSSGLATRRFVPGQDEDRWLQVNNRAFASHPEQGGWGRDDILRRERQPWFDPAGFLLHEIDGKLAAFCWTKVHADETPPLGEIYVIAVDPAFAGRGLGGLTTRAGLEHLATAGITVAMLYVDAANAPARAVYDRLGFTVHHTDRSYVAQVPPETPTSAPMP